MRPRLDEIIVTLPHDTKAELAAVNLALEHPDSAADLQAEWFYDLRLASVILVIQGLLTAGIQVEAGIVAHRLGSEHIETLSEILREYHPVETFAHWRGIVLEQFHKRKTMLAAQEFLTHAAEANGEFPLLISKLEAELQQEILGAHKVSDGKDCARLLTDHLENRYQRQGQLSGIGTNFRLFDRYTDGLQPAEQTVIAARPSIGKSAIAINIVQWVCLHENIPVLVVSMEMRRTALLQRLLSSSFSIPMAVLRRGEFTEAQFRLFTAFNCAISRAPLWIVEAIGGMGIDQYCSVVRQHCKRHGIKLVVTDYLQKLRGRGKHEKRTYEVAQVGGEVQALAVSTGASFLTLAQLNRESEKDKGRLPRLSDLADSASIERDADCVALLHRKRDPKEAHLAYLIVAKQRDGETGIVPLTFDGQFVRFTDREEEP